MIIINDIELVLRQRKFELKKEDITNNLKEQKELAVRNDNQDQAKYIWCLEQVFKVKSLFIEAFNLMKKGDFEKAWLSLDRSDIELSFLKPHFDYSDNKYELEYIEKEIPKYQKLFPYDFFSSRESIESDFTCTICGAKLGLRKNECGHRVGQIYNGEMCGRQVNEIEFISISIVKKPMDKYTILHVEGMEYNYFLLETLIQYLDNPFEKWGYDIEEFDWNYKNDERYKNIGRNDVCPCKSGKKFKKCCLIDKRKTKHYKFWGENCKFL
ncbi:SEC-C metal-binding domain-containing protein [Desulfosporosinus nitroreducens]|uniref:SEC-C metal-binding domain-containing protein n=1 Tax=Desulfosporosinus nitroreducens TaxID=2018668 RepID=A0ABT8QR43_9FIRM|nr:SEC-C metal-binding domain-containing protein [Desulfosporosinus nitroreducens]MDO0823322.1 SEC-C metal-binding domain-containing protein [Desulfosporosinus nitroreducens]